jgi:hypothetical protein
MKTPEGFSVANLCTRDRAPLIRHVEKILSYRAPLYDEIFVAGNASPRLVRQTSMLQEIESLALKRLIKKFSNGLCLAAAMVQRFTAGCRLEQHRDGAGFRQPIGPYKRIIIINLCGTADFYLTNGCGISPGSFRMQAKPGLIVILDPPAVDMYHGVPVMPTDRINIVLRYGREKNRG